MQKSYNKIKISLFDDLAKSNKGQKIKAKIPKRERIDSIDQFKSSQQQILSNNYEQAELRYEIKNENKGLNLNLDSKTKINNYILHHKPSEENLNKNPTLVLSKNISSIRKAFDPKSINIDSDLNRKKNTDFDESKTRNIEFTSFFWVKTSICKPKEHFEKRKFTILKDLIGYLNQRLDINYYLKMLYSIDISNNLLFDSMQKKIIDNAAKPNIFSVNDLKFYGLQKLRDKNVDNQEITEYYNSKFAQKNADKYDKILMQILPEKVKKAINKES